MQTLTETLPYPITIGENAWQNVLPDLTRTLATEYVIVTDSTVASHHLSTVRSLIADDKRCGLVVIPAGESHKTLDTLGVILEGFAAFQLTRSGAVLALGGGVVGDLAGFAAAIWLRGVQVVQIPTTLLAMVDSAIGGKTAADLPSGKNLIGAFHPPVSVIADTLALKTLPSDDILDGTAELLKTAVIGDAALFSDVLNNPERVVDASVISRAVRIKAGIVSRDLTEQGERKLLNLGHTFGHALEIASGFSLSHGKAVAMGMVISAKIGIQLGITSLECYRQIVGALRKVGLPSPDVLSPSLGGRGEPLPYTFAQLLGVMMMDKKRRGDTITLVIPENIGHCVLKTLTLSSVGDLL